MKKLTALFLFLFSALSFANWEVEEKKINYLLDEIGKLDAKFIRNGSEHTAQEAAKHLRMKLNSAQNSWFAPAKEKWTAELFIKKVASGSSLSGKDYHIQVKGKKKIKSRVWLLEKLRTYSPQKKASKK